MNYMQIKYPDVANGPGIRVSLFVSGCDRHCEGCFNPESWPHDAGKLMTYREYNEILRLLDKPEVAGLSVLGGEPLLPENLSGVSWLIQAAVYAHPDKPVWIWSGYTYEELVCKRYGWLSSEMKRMLRDVLDKADVLVDGPYIEAQRDLTLRFRGSKNQRIIDLKRTRQAKSIVLWEDESQAAYMGTKQQNMLDYIRRGFGENAEGTGGHG